MSVRRTGAGISYASGYNSEIPKSNGYILQKRPNKKKKRKKKKKERKLTNELQSIWDGDT